MCGIAGYLHFDPFKNAERAVIKKMTDCISYRGPDGEGFYVNKNIGLGHRRLSIIDLNTGNQPMLSIDEKKIIVFNGEIYNYTELKEELIKFGYSFRTNSDTEVILNAYDKWGYDCQTRLNGMWAFAIYDKVKEELFLSRDRVGEKPLHFCVCNNTLVFSSEIKSIFAYGIEKQIRTELIELYLSLTNIPGPNTFYKNIYKLMPGHFIIVKNGQLKECKYWDLPELDESNMFKDKKMIYETFDNLFKDSIKIRMRSDVPFGAFLSGGLDSSSIVTQMSKFSSIPVKTFTIGFSEKEYDESILAQEVATKFKTEHHLGNVEPDNFETYLKRAVTHFDEPFGDSSAIPTDLVSSFASKKVKMVLTGDGGDEVLSGYTSYQGIKLSNLINRFPSLIRTSVPNINDKVGSFLRGNIRYKLNKVSHIIRTSSLPFPARMAEKATYTSLSTVRGLCTRISDQITIEDYFSDLMKKCSYKNDFYKLMYLNFKHNLPDDYLVKVDRMSMANSIETRLPFLDHRIIEFMAKVDLNVKMQGWERKSVLRNTIGKELPKNVLKAPKKGFGVPLREWFKDNSFDEHFINSTRKISEILDYKFIQQIKEENKKGTYDNGNFIWTLMMLDRNL